MSKTKRYEVKRQGSLIWWGDSKLIANGISCRWPGSIVSTVIHYSPKVAR